MAQCVFIYAMPVVADDGGDEQQQCALGLVEVGDDALYHVMLVSGHNHQAGGAGNVVGVLFVHVVLQGFQRLLCSDAGELWVLVRLPLLDQERGG